MSMKQDAYYNALDLIDIGCEPTSAFKQAGSDTGIEFGDEMGEFVSWCWAQYCPE